MSTFVWESSHCFSCCFRFSELYGLGLCFFSPLEFLAGQVPLRLAGLFVVVLPPGCRFGQPGLSAIFCLRTGLCRITAAVSLAPLGSCTVWVFLFLPDPASSGAFFGLLPSFLFLWGEDHSPWSSPVASASACVILAFGSEVLFEGRRILVREVLIVLDSPCCVLVRLGFLRFRPLLLPVSPLWALPCSSVSCGVVSRFGSCSE